MTSTLVFRVKTCQGLPFAFVNCSLLPSFASSSFIALQVDSHIRWATEEKVNDLALYTNWMGIWINKRWDRINLQSSADDDDGVSDWMRLFYCGKRWRWQEELRLTILLSCGQIKWQIEENILIDGQIIGGNLIIMGLVNYC